MYSNIYFIGIGGIGMSALARYFLHKGCKVAGYDRTPSALTHELEAEGMAVHYEDRPDLIPADVSDTLVIYTPAIPETLGELATVRAGGYKLLKRAQALGEIAKGQRCLAVAGTHGKTTTSTLVAHIITQSGEGCDAFLGGISKNYGTNMLESDSGIVVVEADEYDRSFHCLYPEIAAITAMDADHLDIYGDLAHVQESFRIFASQVSGTLILKYGLPVDNSHTGARILTYSCEDTRADFHATNLRLSPLGQFTFDLVHPGGVLKDILVGPLGKLNVENSVAAAAICLCHGTDPEAIKDAIGSYQGARRRLDVHVNTPGLTYIDDYAHHPEELGCAIRSIREIFPSRKITAIFQPHLYTRTRDFAPEFAEALGGVDKLILLDIYPARELPIPGVTSEIIFSRVTCPDKVMLNKADLMQYLENEPLDVLVSFGAGDIDRFIDPITAMLCKRLDAR